MRVGRHSFPSLLHPLLWPPLSPNQLFDTFFSHPNVRLCILSAVPWISFMIHLSPIICTFLSSSNFALNIYWHILFYKGISFLLFSPSIFSFSFKVLFTMIAPTVLISIIWSLIIVIRKWSLLRHLSLHPQVCYKISKSSGL